MPHKVLALLLGGLCSIAVTAALPARALAEGSECRQGEVVLAHKHRRAGLTRDESSALSSILSIVEQRGNMVRGLDLSSASRAGLETPGRCPTEEKICRNLTRKAKLKGRGNFTQLHRLSCSYNYKIKTTAVSDDYSSALWGLTAANGINAPAAWNYTTGSADVVTAVIDTGIDYNHVDLAANTWTNPNEIPGNGIDDDQNGWIDDIHGINAITNTGNPLDDHWHGTHVSGTIGAVGNNNTGVVGVNWTVRIIGVKALDQNGSGALSNAVKGINYLVDLRQNYGIPIKVANNSWGYAGSAYTALDTAIRSARDAGILFVAAAGNSNSNNDVTPFYPARTNSENVISVAAVDQNGARASFSNYSANTVSIAAPGVSIRSTTPNNNYGSASGTSMAAPHVTGAVALVAAANPSLSWTQLRDIILGNADYNAALAPYVIGGRDLNVARAVEAAQGVPPSVTPVPPTVTPTPSPTKKPKIKKPKKKSPAQRRAGRKAKKAKKGS